MDHRTRTIILAPATAILLVVFGWWNTIQPQNNRYWALESRVIPSVTFNGDQFTIKNFRQFRYPDSETIIPAYTDATFDLRQLKRAWFVIEPFSKWKGSAHTFLSFEFEGPRYLAISVEARLEEGETFSFPLGLRKGMELMYVIGDEQDLIYERTNHRHNAVSLYPVRASTDGTRNMLLSMLERANALYEKPEFYHTLWNNCTSNVIAHVREIAPEKVHLTWRMIFPGYADAIAYEAGLIDTALPYKDIRSHFSINERAMVAPEDGTFSVRIREFPDEESVTAGDRHSP